MNKHQIGYLSESRAATYFIEQGYEVYWPSFTQSSCDFIITKSQDVQRVQVKTAYWMERKSGKRYLQTTTRKGCGRGGYSEYTREECDLIVIVYEDKLWAITPEQLGGKQNLILELGHERERKGSFDAEVFRIR